MPPATGRGWRAPEGRRAPESVPRIPPDLHPAAVTTDLLQSTVGLENAPAAERDPQGMAGFVERHVGPGPREQQRMLAELGLSSLEELTAAVVPADILLPPEAAREGLPEPCGEAEALEELAAIAAANQVRRSLIGLGYHGTATRR